MTEVMTFLSVVQFEIHRVLKSTGLSNCVDLWDTVSMSAKHNLRVVKWLGTVPAVAVCTGCARSFKVPSDSLKRTSEAQENLRKQFEEHRCQRGEASQAASRTVSETTEKR